MSDLIQKIMKLDIEMEIKHKKSRLTENQNHIRCNHPTNGKKQQLPWVQNTQKKVTWALGNRDYSLRNLSIQ